MAIKNQMNYLFTFWVKMSSGDLNPCSVQSKSLALAYVELQKEIETSMRYIKRIDIECLEEDPLSDSMVINAIELACALAEKDVETFYQHQEKKFIIPNPEEPGGTKYTDEAQGLFDEYYEDYLKRIKNFK